MDEHRRILWKRLLWVHGAEVITLALLATLPLTVNNSYALGLLTLMAIYGITLIGLDITVGYLGQVNLAQAAFLGLGAYTAGLSVTHMDAGMLGALALSGLVGGVLGGLLALPSLRLDGPQFALSTLSFSALTTTVLNEWESLTGGAQGLVIIRPGLFGLALDAKGFYWLCLILFGLVWLTLRNLLSSQWGRAFEALRDSPIATDAMGIGAYRHKVAAFALGSGLGGLAGGLYAFNFQYLQPQSFTYELMVILLLGVVLGGRKNLWGAFAGAALIVLLPNLLSNRGLFQLLALTGLILALFAGGWGLWTKKTPPFQAVAPILAMGLLVGGGLWVDNTEDWRKAIFALMLFSVVVGLPEGVMGFTGRFLSRQLRLEPPPLAPAEILDRVLPPRSTSGHALLELHDLQRHFGGIRAVDGISMTLRAGQVQGLIGPNGSGKSTLVNVITGLYPPSAGHSRLQGQLLPTGSLFRVAQRGIARTFQNLQLFSELSALDNIKVALRGAYRRPLPIILLGFGKNEERRAQAAALSLLTFVGLQTEALMLAKGMTYGNQRLLEIARALARRPDLLILDEPAAGLAHADVIRLIDLIRDIRRRGISVLLIEHHMDVVTELCDVVTVLDGGRVVVTGTPEEIKRHPRVIAAYLGSPGDDGVPAC